MTLKSPKLFIIGAQKSGTTALATLLGQHPQICLAAPKEPDFFTRHYKHGLDWYYQRFSNPDADWLLDASTSYSDAPLPGFDSDKNDPNNPLLGVPERIREVCGGDVRAPRFIYIMRDPVARTHSGYWHAVRAGEEHRPFEEAIARPDAHYLRLGDYAGQLQYYLKIFPREHILLLFFEQFKHDPQAVARRCLRFIDLDDAVAPLSADGGQNKSFVYAGPLGMINRRLSERGGGGLSPAVKKLAAVTPRPLKRLAARLITKPVPPLTDAQRQQLTEHFAPRNAALEALLGEPLAYWSSPSASSFSATGD